MERKIIGLFLTAFLLFSPEWVFSESLSQKKNELEKLQRELLEKRKIEKKNKKLENSILSEFENIDKKWSNGKKELRHYERNIKNKDQEINSLNQQIENLKKRIEEKKIIINARLRRIYKEDKMGDLLILTTGKNYQDFTTRVHAMVGISKRDVTALNEYEDGMRLLKEKEGQVEGKRKELVEIKKEAAGKIELLENEKINKKLLLAKVRTEKELTRQAIRELEESTLKVQELMRKLELNPSNRSGFFAEKGRLPWPNRGEVVGNFGRNKHPKFDFYVMKKGWEIKPTEEDYIRAIYDGVVVYADWFKGYGLLMIIDHGEGYYSLYAHASKLMVGVGDKVKQNHVIGEIGETGYSMDRNLYFEIRQGEKAVDPSLWLTRKK
ncbi:MAG: peptidoglycan DD-metalloendopeptidase family protein [Nitrospirae bacterium]|nr:peptidoglycan DD-metalloendopeptidase family protein [Nitrospirota bacterium]MBI3352619.1 peptidoglycan DD-metalloendopeptidase family protein [Nitrospirota bacterium]